jgi:hypothetical protein
MRAGSGKVRGGPNQFAFMTSRFMSQAIGKVAPIDRRVGLVDLLPVSESNIGLGRVVATPGRQKNDGFALVHRSDTSSV